MTKQKTLRSVVEHTDFFGGVAPALGGAVIAGCMAMPVFSEEVVHFLQERRRLVSCRRPMERVGGSKVRLSSESAHQY